MQPRHDRDKTETSRRQGSIIGRHTGQSYAGLPKGAQYTNSNWNLRFCLKTRSKCSSVFITKKSKHNHQSKKQHCNINDKTPSHHPLIIINITAPSPHITETSPKHARDVANDQRITERSPKHHPKTNKTTPKQQLDISKKRQRQDGDTTKNDRDMTETSQKHHQNNTETSPSQHRDKTTSQRHHQNNTETSRRQDKTKTRPTHDRDMSETSPRHHRDKTQTTPQQHRDITQKRQRQDRDTTET